MVGGWLDGRMSRWKQKKPDLSLSFSPTFKASGLTLLLSHLRCNLSDPLSP